MLSKLAVAFRRRQMSFPTILRRSLPSRPLRPRAVPTGLLAALALAVVTAVAGGADSWQRHAPLPEPRTELAAAVAAGGEIVAVGGFVAGGANTARADAYSIANDRWRRLPDLPVAVD